MHRKGFEQGFVDIKDRAARCKSGNADNNRGTAHIERTRLIRGDLRRALHMKEPSNPLLERAFKRLGVEFSKRGLLAR